MKEFVEFRVDEELAPMLFSDNEGKRLGTSIRAVVLEPHDPRYSELGRLNKLFKEQQGKLFFYGWEIKRVYTPRDIANAKLFSFEPTVFFEPAGEECGTLYDESTACVCCGAGATQVGPLYLPYKRLKKTKDVIKTIGGEIVVSQRFKDIVQELGVVDVEFPPVYDAGNKEPSKDWFQLNVQAVSAMIASQTRIGFNPFDNDSKDACRCPLGDLLGLNLLSEVSIKSGPETAADLFCSRQFVGTRRGLLRPRRLIFVSPRLAEALRANKIKGIELEVAHVV